MIAVRILDEPGDQTIVFKDFGNLQNFVNGQGGTGTFMCGYSPSEPYYALSQSSYSGFINVYELCRIKKIHFRVSIPGATMNVGGLTAAKLYRDGRTDNKNPYYEGLVQERLVSRGKAWTVYDFTWYPIEPSDYEYAPMTNALDNGRFGQLNFAAITFPSPFSNIYTPVVETTYTVEFKYLKDPKVPTFRINNQKDYDEYCEIQHSTARRPETPQILTGYRRPV
jgi:hypothetical protein